MVYVFFTKPQANQHNYAPYFNRIDFFVIPSYRILYFFVLWNREILVSLFGIPVSWKSLLLIFFFHIGRGGSRTAATSTMEHFMIIFNSWKPLTIITKSSILNVAVVLDPPLYRLVQVVF